DAALRRARRHEDEQPVDGHVRRQERARRPAAEVEVVEPEPYPAVDLQVRAERRARLRRRRRELVAGGHLAEVHERLDVPLVDARHGVADDADHGGVAGGEEVADLHPRERPEHHVAEVVRGHRRAGAAAAVDGDPHLRVLLRREVARRRDLLPRVRQEALERAAPRAADAGLEAGDELRREVDGEVPHPLQREGAVGVAPAPLAPELDVPVVERRRRRDARRRDGRPVEERRREGGAGGAHGGGPLGEEDAHGLAVGDLVVAHRADHQPAARVPRQLHLQQWLLIDLTLSAWG
ncbi:Os10g0379233, partial [Oryza sativa Japonica Group]